MRCRGCGYLLFDLPPGPCPECGREFRPTEFRFKPRRVGFLCSACGHAYQGLDADGLPQPKRFACKECGAEVDAAHMIVTLPDGARPENVMVEDGPWQERSRTGWRKAAQRTYLWSLIRPAQVVRGLPDEGGLLDAYKFALAIYGFLAMVGMLLALLVGMLFGAGGALIGVALIGVWALLLTALNLLVAVPLWALMSHGLLAITGARAGGYRITLRTLLYAQGPALLSFVPYCGLFVGGIWSLVSASLMLTTAQRVSGVRGTFAACLPSVVVYALLFIGALALVFSPAFILGGTATFTPQLNGVATALQISHFADGAPPKHVLGLVDRNYISIEELIGATNPDGSFILGAQDQPLPGGGVVADLLSMSTEEILDVAAELENDDEFYAFGDLIYCYRGVDYVQAPPRLAVAYSRPAASSRMFDDVVVFYTLGTVEVFSAQQWKLERRRQNALRQTLGLSPLPWESGLPPTLEELYGVESP